MSTDDIRLNPGDPEEQTNPDKLRAFREVSTEASVSREAGIKEESAAPKLKWLLLLAALGGLAYFVLTSTDFELNSAPPPEEHVGEDNARAPARPEPLFILGGDGEGHVDHIAELEYALTGDTEFLSSGNRVQKLAFRPDGAVLASAAEHDLILWNAETGAIVARTTYAEHVDAADLWIHWITFDRTGERLLLLPEHGELLVFDAHDLEFLEAVDRPPGIVYDYRRGKDGRVWVVFGMDEIAVQRWKDEAEGGGAEIVYRRKLDAQRELYELQFDPDQQRLKIVYTTLERLVDTATDTVLAESELDEAPQYDGGFSGEKVLAENEQLRIVSDILDDFAYANAVEDGRTVSELRHNRAVSCAAFAPDGRTLATAGYDMYVRIWKTPQLQQ